MTYFEEIDAWLLALFIGAEDADEDEDQWFDRVAKAIKAKILESYRNGQKAGVAPENLPMQEKPRRSKFWPRRRRDGRR